MGFIQLLTSLWPFLKEMFFGEKIKDSTASKDGADSKAKDRKLLQGHFAVTAAHWCVNKMQESKRFLAFVLMLLLLSLFVNYKFIMRYNSMVPPREEEQSKTEPSATQEPKEKVTIPRKNDDTEVVLKQTVEELKNLYGEK